MGNRAVITFDPKPTENSVGVYLHWNGGAESVLAFLQTLDTYNVRDNTDTAYQLARFIQIIGNYFGGTLSLGVGNLSNLDCDNGNNGLFVACREKGKITLKHMPQGLKRKRQTRLNLDDVRKHAYWKPDDKGENILNQIREKNDVHFVDSKNNE